MKHSDTSIAGGHDQFPSTRWEDLVQAGDPKASGAKDALNRLAEAYWRPVYRYIRVVWKKSNEDAKDLTQEFFATIFDPEFVARSDPDRGTFRAFVITSLRNFLTNQEKARKRLKRGGGVNVVSLEFTDSEGDSALRPIAQGETPEEYFDRAWAQSVLDRAMEMLRSKFLSGGKSKAYDAFRLYCLEGDENVSYRAIAEELEVSEKDVDNYIYAARREFREVVAQVVREYVSDPSFVAEELKRLFGR